MMFNSVKLLFTSAVSRENIFSNHLICIVFGHWDKTEWGLNLSNKIKEDMSGEVNICIWKVGFDSGGKSTHILYLKVY